MILAGLAFALVVNCCDGGSGMITKEVINEEPTVAVVETVPYVPETTAAPVYIPEPKSTDGFVAYRIYGITPPIEWQRYLYGKLEERGIAWYMPYAVCQIFQESRWNQWSDNGRDFGLTQQKGIYWESRAAYYGIPGADIWDPYAQLHVFACMMEGFLSYYGGDVGMALSVYYLGAWEYSAVYVDNVMAHWPALEEVR